MPEHIHALSDPRVFAGTGLDHLGAAPLRPVDPVQVGPFRLLALLGGGGMGRVYLGREPGAPVYRGLAAVKVIRPEYAEDPQFRRRFEREAEALARVQGGPTAVLLGSGFDGDLLWMATEYIPGLSLTGTVADHGVLGPAAAWRLAADLGRAVAALERAEVVHRDIKPSNVVLGPDGCRLIDFGISQASGTSSITVTGQQVGTPAYMSPEQVRGLPVVTSSDVFALGSVLAYAVTGNAPFGDGTSVDVLHRVAFEPPKPEVLERVAAVDTDLSALVAACLDKEQDRRPSAEEVIATALTRQVLAPWPQGLSDAIMTCIQVTDAVAQLPLEPLGPAAAPGPAAVEGTFVLGAHTPPPSGPPTPRGPHTPATVPAAGDGRSAWSTPVQTAPLQAAPYQAGPVHPGPVHQAPVHPGAVPATPPTEAAGRFAPYVIQAPGPQPGPVAPQPAPQERPRRIGLLVSGAAVAVAAAAGLALLVAGPSGHASAAGSGTAGASATNGAGGSFQAGAAPSGSGSASAGSSATAARPSGSATATATATASAGSSATARSHHGGSPTAGASAATPSQPGTDGTSTQPSAPTPTQTTATPAPPAQPAWIANCHYYSGSAETDPGSTDVAAVKEIQCILSYRGYNVVDGVDGQFGPNTKNAVEAFQRDKGLGVDGEVGQQTWPALRSSS